MAAESLVDAIDLAYQTNPALLAARADQRALDEKYIQAGAALGPTANLSAQQTVAAANVDQLASIFTPATTTYNRASNSTVQLNINQTLYDGGQLSSAISVAQAEVFGGRQSLRQQEAVMINGVITAYLDVLLAQRMVLIDLQTVDALRKLQTETQFRVSLQASTLTDRAQVNARLLAAQIQLDQGRSALVDARGKFLTAVGQPPGQLEQPSDLPGMPPNLDTALDVAFRGNPTLLAAIYTEISSRAGVAQAKSTDGWQIGLSASVSRQPIEPYLAHQNINSLSGAVVINKPLFSSGARASQIRAALEADNRDELKVADERRQVVFAVAQSWDDTSAKRAQLGVLLVQLAEEEETLNGMQIEERSGRRTVTDVLNAEQELQAAKIELAQLYHDEYLTRVALLAAIGVLDAELLDPNLQPYRPAQSLARRNGEARLLPWEGLVALLDSIGSPRLTLARPDVDPLGDQRPSSTAPLPAAPKWSDLAKYLGERVPPVQR